MGDLFRHTHRSDGAATVRLDPTTVADHDVPATMFGKFVEHLYSSRNIENALDAQTLFNPTFGSWKFQRRTHGVDGGRGAIHDHDTIADRIGTYTDNHDLPDADRLRDAYHDGAALWWFPYGETAAIRTSPDVGTAGDRAQRVEVDTTADGQSGVAQWCYLPLHRTREFEGEITLRAERATSVTLTIHDATADDGTLGNPIASTSVTAPSEYETTSFTLSVPEDVSGAPDDLFGISVTVDPADAPANLVVDRVLLYPDDHVDRADPDMIDLLAAADLPVLRWPGGNFVSGYHWRDGVGPIEERPTKPNPAWDGIEPNLFGTAEFLTFCEAVGCEPLICVNAGDGSADEAAKWVEYCNGSTDTEMGALRAEHGHPEPFDVDYWEIGNEVYGPWQTTWTTPGGYADRFARFREAMTAVDPDIDVFACGNRLTDWNQPLLDRADELPWLTDHILLGCHADPTTDPAELYNAHTGVAAQLREEYRSVADDCAAAGHPETKVAITELQLFTRFEESDVPDGDRQMNADDLPRNSSITEAVFDTVVLNACLRDDTVRMITHSGVGNHGAGVRKERERVWAEPCYYGQRLGAGLVGGTPIGIDVACDTYATETTFGAESEDWFGELRPVTDEPVVDATAVVDADDYGLTVLLAHRDATTTDVDVVVEGDGLLTDYDEVTVTTLTGDEMTSENTYDDQNRVIPDAETRAVDDGRVQVTLPQYGIVRITAASP